MSGSQTKGGADVDYTWQIVSHCEVNLVPSSLYTVNAYLLNLQVPVGPLELLLNVFYKRIDPFGTLINPLSSGMLE